MFTKCRSITCNLFLMIVHAAFHYARIHRLNLFKWIQNYVSKGAVYFLKINICFIDSNARELSIDPMPDRASWWIKKEIPFSFSYYLIEARLRHWLPTRPQMAAPDAGKIILWILIYSVFHFSIVARTVTSASNYNYFLFVQFGDACREAEEKCTRRIQRTSFPFTSNSIAFQHFKSAYSNHSDLSTTIVFRFLSFVCR